MKLRQARKIMKNIRLNPHMELLYGIGRAMKANAICVHHYAPESIDYYMKVGQVPNINE